MRRMTYVLVWLAVTATAVFVAAAAVGSVRNQVTEAPTAMIPITSTTVTAATATSAPPTEADPLPTTTSTTRPTATSTTTTAAPVTTTTASTGPALSTTTTTAPGTAPPRTDIRSYDLVGGVVTVEIGSSFVNLSGASPKSGFSMEVEDSGPKKVEVEFKSNSHESKFSGEIRGGTFVPEVEESDREEHDD